MKKIFIILALALVSISANAQYITEYQSNNGHSYQLCQQPTIENIDRYQSVINLYENSLQRYKNASNLFWTAIGVELAGAGIMGLSLLGGEPDNIVFLGGGIISGVAGIVATVGLVNLCISSSDLRHSQLLLSANGIVMTF